MTRAVDDLMARLPILEVARGPLEEAIVVAARTLRGGGKLLVCGNGGSASDSEHLVADLMKGFMAARPIEESERVRLVAQAGDLGEAIATRLQGSLPALSLVSQAALTTAIANDIRFDMVFAQQIHGLGTPSDLLFAMSTSGVSPSVVNGAIVARARSMPVIALTGRDGGDLARFSDVAIRVPADLVFEIQELHLPVYHAFALALEEMFFGHGASDGVQRADGAPLSPDPGA
jgi:phosphoheptose isomerase